MNIKHVEESLEEMRDTLGIMTAALNDAIRQMQSWRGVSPEVVKLEDKRKQKSD